MYLFWFFKKMCVSFVPAEIPAIPPSHAMAHTVAQSSIMLTDSIKSCFAGCSSICSSESQSVHWLHVVFLFLYIWLNIDVVEMLDSLLWDRSDLPCDLSPKSDQLQVNVSTTFKTFPSMRSSLIKFPRTGERVDDLKTWCLWPRLSRVSSHEAGQWKPALQNVHGGSH